MGPPVKLYNDLGGGHRDRGRHIDEIPEDLARLGVRVAPHGPRQEPVEATGDDEEGHVEVLSSAKTPAGYAAIFSKPYS